MSFVVASPAQSNQILYLILLILPLLAKLAPGFYVMYVLSRSVTYPAKNFSLMGVSVMLKIYTDVGLHYSNPSPSTNRLNPFSRIACWCRFTLSASFISSINADIPLSRFKATSGVCPSHSFALSLSGI